MALCFKKLWYAIFVSKSYLNVSVPPLALCHGIPQANYGVCTRDALGVYTLCVTLSVLYTQCVLCLLCTYIACVGVCIARMQAFSDAMHMHLWECTYVLLIPIHSLGYQTLLNEKFDPLLLIFISSNFHISNHRHQNKLFWCLWCLWNKQFVLMSMQQFKNTLLLSCVPE